MELSVQCSDASRGIFCLRLEIAGKVYFGQDALRALLKTMDLQDVSGSLTGDLDIAYNLRLED